MGTRTVGIWFALGIVGLALGAALTSPAFAGRHLDRHGNEGYDTAAECDAAVRAGKAKFYKSATQHPPLLREGEASVKVQTLADLTIPREVVMAKTYGASNYNQAACDIGVPRSAGRDGVSIPLQGKFIPYAPGMRVNVYHSAAGNPVRVTMKDCDNWFGHSFPRPVPIEQLQCPADPAGNPASISVPATPK